MKKKIVIYVVGFLSIFLTISCNKCRLKPGFYGSSNGNYLELISGNNLYELRSKSGLLEVVNCDKNNPNSSFSLLTNNSSFIFNSDEYQFLYIDRSEYEFKLDSINALDEAINTPFQPQDRIDELWLLLRLEQENGNVGQIPSYVEWRKSLQDSIAAKKLYNSNRDRFPKIFSGKSFSDWYYNEKNPIGKK